MDMIHAQNHQKHAQKTSNNNKKRLTQEQVRLLERTFTTNKKLEPELKLQLANQLGVPPRQIAIWYQNKRARWRTQTLELDYNTIQLRLENALSDKRRLEKQVVHLQQELLKAQEMLFAMNYQQGGASIGQVPSQQPYYMYNNNNYVSNCTSSCDEVGSSSLHEENSTNNEGLQLKFDELYACLIGRNDDGSHNQL